MYLLHKYERLYEFEINYTLVHMQHVERLRTIHSHMLICLHQCGICANSLFPSHFVSRGLFLLGYLAEDYKAKPTLSTVSGNIAFAR